MTPIFRGLLALALFASFNVFADGEDPGFGGIKKIDLSDEGPKNPDHILMSLNLKKIKPGHLAQVTIYQFSKRVRIDFDADLPKGEYTLATADSCSAKRASFKELHKFNSTSAHVQTERSLPKYSLFPMSGFTALSGKALALFRKTPAQTVDCQTIKNSVQENN